MRLISLELESKLREKGLWPQSWVARAALYVVGLELLLLAVLLLTRRVSPATSQSLEGWADFLSALALVLFAIAGYRRLRLKLLWRLRNRLIVTYVFIGVIPVFLWVMISLITLYLFAGQFASFVVTSDITTHLRGMESANRAIAHHLAAQASDHGILDAEVLGRARPHRPEWLRRQICAWYGNQPRVYCSGPEGAAGFDPNRYIGTGARYNPATDTWTEMTLTGAPSPRVAPSGVWTGKGLLFFGGYNGRHFNETWFYSPSQTLYPYSKP